MYDDNVRRLPLKKPPKALLETAISVANRWSSKFGLRCIELTLPVTRGVRYGVQSLDSSQFSGFDLARWYNLRKSYDPTSIDTAILHKDKVVIATMGHIQPLESNSKTNLSLDLNFARVHTNPKKQKYEPLDEFTLHYFYQLLLAYEEFARLAGLNQLTTCLEDPSLVDYFRRFDFNIESMAHCRLPNLARPVNNNPLHRFI